jgi:hypothetical protein
MEENNVIQFNKPINKNHFPYVLDLPNTHCYITVETPCDIEDVIISLKDYIVFLESDI